MKDKYVVLLETSGNQRYIFATNKLRENVGASELTYRAGTRYVLDAIASALQSGARRSLWDDSPHVLRANLVDRGLNPAIEQEGNAVEVVVATSGKAILLVEGEGFGRRIVEHATRRALLEAPGLDLRGVVARI